MNLRELETIVLTDAIKQVITAWLKEKTFEEPMHGLTINVEFIDVRTLGDLGHKYICGHVTLSDQSTEGQVLLNIEANKAALLAAIAQHLEDLGQLLTERLK